MSPMYCASLNTFNSIIDLLPKKALLQAALFILLFQFYNRSSDKRQIEIGTKRSIFFQFYNRSS